MRARLWAKVSISTAPDFTAWVGVWSFMPQLAPPRRAAGRDRMLRIQGFIGRDIYSNTRNLTDVKVSRWAVQHTEDRCWPARCSVARAPPPEPWFRHIGTLATAAMH